LGNSLELRDGLYSIEEVKKIIPANFSGIIHLATCNSLILGERLKIDSANDTRRLIMNPRPIHPSTIMLMCKFLYHQLNYGQYNYGQLLLDIHQKFLRDTQN
jgi:hypothetical protein